MRCLSTVRVQWGVAFGRLKGLGLLKLIYGVGSDLKLSKVSKITIQSTYQSTGCILTDMLMIVNGFFKIYSFY